MKKPRSLTAQELMLELENNPEYQRRRQFADEKMKRRAEQIHMDASPLLAELRTSGIVVGSVDELYRNFSVLPDRIVEVLIRHLPLLRDGQNQESVVRALGVANSPFDGTCLVNCFETTTSEAIKFAVLNTVAIAKPHSIDLWTEGVLSHPYYGRQLKNLM